MGLLQDYNERVKKLAVDVMHVELVKPNNTHELVTSVRPNKKYWLVLKIKNSGVAENSIFTKTVLRVQGKANQLEFYENDRFNQVLPPDYQGQPRVHLKVGQLGPGQISNPIAYFKAKKQQLTKNLKFKIGVYADIRPYGKYWKNDSPNL